MFPANEIETDNFVNVCHAISTLQKDPDPILAPMMNLGSYDEGCQ